MRTQLEKNKRTGKVIRMKPVSAKGKKGEQKTDKDYVSETISFVIKGKLTPIKPFVAKKAGVVKKAAKKKGVPNVKAKPTMKKTRKTGDRPKLSPKVQTKTANKPTSAQKAPKKSTSSESIPNPAQDAAKSEAIGAQANKNETPKRSAKETKPLKKVKAAVADAKKKPKKAVTKRIKAPIKTEPLDKNKEKTQKDDSHAETDKAEDIKTKQTIEKLLKQANRALKQPSSKNATQKAKKSHKCEKKAKLSAKTEPAAKSKAKAPTQLSVKQETNDGGKKQPKRRSPGDSPEDTSTSDDLTLNELCKSTVKTEIDAPKSKRLKIKAEPLSDGEKKTRKQTIRQKKIPPKSNLVLMKKRVIGGVKDKVKRKENPRARKMKLFGFWNGPKRHRVASLNALAKVHCLYENETRSNLLDPIEIDARESTEEKTSIEDDVVPCTRTLRSVPGLRAVGKHWDMHDTTSSSDDNSGYESTGDVEEKPKAKVKKESAKKSDSSKKPEQKRRRNRTELIMDLKDMVVRKRMASLNASAILAASYSVEKRTSKSPKSDSEIDSSDYFNTDNEDEADKNCFEAKVKKEDDNKLIEVRATPNKKVAVILNQDTDVTITGVYVNSTTRSTHHEGYCSIAGMQYRISATSHTQTAATAVATETLLQSSSSSTQENSNSESLTSCKSYTPLDALSNMQPPPGPGIQHGVPHQHMGPPQHVLPLPQHQLSPSRRHGCPSAFSAPHAAPPYPPHHPPLPADPGYVHGYYQPAGPLISVPHGHTQQPPPPPPITKSAPLSETSAASTSPIHQPPPPPPSSNGDSSDSEVIITSVTAGKEAPPPPPQQQQQPSTYRYSQYPGTPPGYPYGYPHYYPTPPPAPSYAHHELCYPTSPYLHHKYPPTTYRRFLPSTQYYAPNPADMYATPPTGPSQQNQQVVTATPVSASSSSYQPPPSGPPPAIMEPYPPPPTLVETYPHPTHYYPSYGPAPPPSCYTHSPATRTLPYINATYQSCPCPMQSCPKNVLTGPLTGDGKRSNISSIAKDSMPLPPVALALPLEPASATGPPSPARGSAGMPPPPSPAGATYQPPPPAPKQEEYTPVEKKRKARVGKAMVRNNIAAIQQNTMLLMCHPNQRNFPGEVKREIESPKEKETEAKKEICSDDEVKAPTTLEPEIKNIIVEAQNLKQEEGFEEKEIEQKEEELNEEVTQCVKTVAENVKVKNMKRKLSTSSEKKSEEEEPESVKKLKLEAKYPNGSYKDLIRKDTTTVKINNGKRKLITEEDADALPKKTKAKGKKATKRKLKEEETTATKRLKQTKPLTASNQQNSKQYSKEKDKNKSEPVLIENKEPHKKPTKKLPVNSKCGKKLAPAILDSLLLKNNIDRTIDSVISESSVRTNTSALKTAAKVNKEPVLTNRKSTNNKNGQIKSKIECRNSKSVITRRKSKCKDVVPQAVTRAPRRSSQMPRWSNGWMWEGQSFEAKVFLNSDETTVVRKCYPAMRHEEGDVIEVRDCVLLKAGPRKNDLPFVAKIAYLWENPDDGEMMMSLLWYYRPEHTEQGRTPADQPDEVFASRHKDSNSVACIDDKCYVLTFHEYCRYRKEVRRVEEGIEETSPCFPIPEPYPRCKRQPPSPLQVSTDMVFFCRRVYDFRQKRIVKNPS